MKTRGKRILSIVIVLFAVSLAIGGWTAVKVVAWARDLPNRVVIDGDALANALGQAVVESYHVALRDGDTAIQRQILIEQFAPLVRQHNEGATWIRSEFLDDITALVDSHDPKVSDAASDLMGLLDADPAYSKSQNGG